MRTPCAQMPYRNLRVDFHQLLWTGTVFSVMFESSVPRPVASKSKVHKTIPCVQEKNISTYIDFSYLFCICFVYCSMIT